MPDHENRIFHLERKHRIDVMTAVRPDGVGTNSSIVVPDHTQQTVTQSAHGFTVGQWIRWTGAAFVLSQADTEPHAEVFGMVSAVIGPDSFVLQTTGFVSGLSGLTPGGAYYLSSTVAGGMTTVEPLALNTVSKPIFFARDANSGWVMLMRGMVNTAQFTAPFVPRMDFAVVDVAGPYPIVQQVITLPYKADVAVELFVSAFATTAAGSRSVTIAWDGAFLGNAQLYFNTLTQHQVMNPAVGVLRGQTSGPHTIDTSAIAANTTMDANDRVRGIITFREVP
jgi:hypothetical protein